MSGNANAPFNERQRRAIQRWQDRGDVHPLTCPVNSTHAEMAVREDGIYCPTCGATQRWVPWFIAEGL